MSDLLHFTTHLGDCKIQDILYELLTNAMDADPSKRPNIRAVGSGCIEISDSGPGLQKENIKLTGRLNPRDPALHGSHGLGLKDIISACVRENRNLKIESCGIEYSFQNVKFKGNDCRIRLVERTIPFVVGTKVFLHVPNASNQITAIKNKFLSFHTKLKPKLTSCDPKIEIYECTSDMPKGGIFMKGVRKTGICDLTRIYNFVNPTPDQKNSISRDHTFLPGTFRKYFKAVIKKVNNSETFGQASRKNKATVKDKNNTQVTLPPELSIVPFVPLSLLSLVESTVVQTVNDHCMTQDYFLWTLGTQERFRIDQVRSNMLLMLRSLGGIAVSETYDQGSWTKNTFLPFVSDIDIIVSINTYSDANAQPICKQLKKALRKRQARIEDSGLRVINCTYQNVEFDLVLDGGKESDRYLKIKNAPEGTRLIMQSFIRAMKYWVNRCGLQIKSCAIEEVVLKYWDIIQVNTERAFRVFLENVGGGLEHPTIKDFYELSPESIANVKVAATATIAMLPV